MRVAQFVDARPARRPVALALQPRSVLCSDSNTDRNAAVPVLPALGGKLKRTMPILRLGALAAAQVRPACRRARPSMSARSVHACMSRAPSIDVEGAAARATGAGSAPRIRAAAEHHRSGGAVEFGDRDHHRASTGSRPRSDAAPLFERLELDRRERRHTARRARRGYPRRPSRRCRPGRRPARSRSARPPHR